MKTSEQLSPASLPARLISAMIDYIVVSGLYIAVSRLFPSSLGSGFLVFWVGALYFTLAHSRVGKGQSIGKALLGLRVFPLSGPGYLGMPKALLRYLSLYGLLIFLAEAPPEYYRSAAISGPSWFLELHMLFAFAWFFASVARILADPRNRGFHDLFSGSIVSRPESESGPTIEHRSPFLVTTLTCSAALFSFFPWWLGIARPPEVEAVLTKRYLLERELNIRLLNAQAIPDEILVEALILMADSLRSTQGREEFTRHATRTLARTPGSMRLRFRLYSDPAQEPLTPNGQPLELVLDSDTMPDAAFSE